MVERVHLGEPQERIAKKRFLHVIVFLGPGPNQSVR
jgi:hypothetical protein